jgi:hypothetical protein
MVPPFLAYYGVMTGNLTLLEDAYNQIKLYRSYLLDTSANNLWRHIVLGSNGTDPGHWSTGAVQSNFLLPTIDFLFSIGNAWAAAGMLRVLGTIQNSRYTNTFKSQQNDLASWVGEIHAAMYPFLVKHPSHVDITQLTYTHAGLEHEPLPQLPLPARHITRQLPRRILHRPPCKHSIPPLPPLGQPHLPFSRREITHRAVLPEPKQPLAASALQLYRVADARRRPVRFS